MMSSNVANFFQILSLRIVTALDPFDLLSAVFADSIYLREDNYKIFNALIMQ